MRYIPDVGDGHFGIVHFHDDPHDLGPQRGYIAFMPGGWVAVSPEPLSSGGPVDIYPQRDVIRVGFEPLE